MILSFKSKETESFFYTKKSRVFGADIKERALRKLIMLNATNNINDLRVPPSNHLEKLSGNLEGFYSIRINNQFRLIFRFENGNASDVYIDDYH